MINVEDLSYQYPTREDFALKGVELQVKKGELLLLTGSTGCGKSTLLKCLNGIIPHEAAGRFDGNVRLGGMNTREHPVRVLAQKVGLVFQNPDEQIFSTRVREEVAFGLENLCFPRAEIISRVEWALEKVGMRVFIGESTNALSGGQKQRVAVAAVLALQPEVLVLDEPISQLDPGGAREVLGVIKKLSGEGMTIILVEHRIHEVAQWADRVVVMDGGKIVLDAPAGKIMDYLEIFRKLGLRSPCRTGTFTGTGQGFLSALQGGYGTEEKSHLSRAEASFKTAFHAGRAKRSAGSGKGVNGRREKVVEVKDLWFSYDSRNGRGWALKGVDLDLFAGEVTAVIGDNGSGKTTLMHHLAGLFKVQKGQVEVAGRDVRRNNAYRLAGTVGIVFQNPALMLTADKVFDEVAFGPRNLKMPPEKLKSNVSECLRLMELEGLAGYHPQTLSGGQRLRCATAAIISMEPQLVLLDEPTSGQDILHIRKLMELCRKMAGQGKTVVFITHDHEIAAEYADRIIVMRDGGICADYAPGEYAAGVV